MTTRTDIHRPSEIVPADYEYVFSYDLGGSGPFDPAINVNCAVGWTRGPHAPNGRCCVFGLKTIAKVAWAPTGSTGKCSVCGANYRYGDVWRHKDGEHIHIGHDCADKYSLLADRSAYELEAGRRDRAKAVQVQRAKNDQERTDFLAQYPGLEEALKVDHEIVRDIASRFVQYRSLSEKQVALVFKLAEEVRNPRPAREEEKKAVAPLGRQTFTGIVVSKKGHAGNFGWTQKLTVKVATPEGVWLAWITEPAAVVTEKGDKVEVTATLEAGREAHFVFGKRPRVKIVVANAEVRNAAVAS